jgi:hypothetical protein
MKSRILIFTGLTFLMVLAACNKDKPIKGKAFVPRETFVDMLVDLHLVDGVTNDRKFYRRFEDVDSIDMLGPILDKYQVSYHMFDTTMFTYTLHPEQFDAVYNDVLTRLNMMQDELDEDQKPGDEGLREEPGEEESGNVESQPEEGS